MSAELVNRIDRYGIDGRRQTSLVFEPCLTEAEMVRVTAAIAAMQETGSDCPSTFAHCGGCRKGNPAPEPVAELSTLILILERIEFDFMGTPGSSDEPWYGLTRRLAHVLTDLKAQVLP
jgi:hypothetical protein